MEISGGILLLTGPSGVGKTVVMEQLMKRFPFLKFAPSYSTRPMRPGETDGNPYFFVSEKEFLEMKERGEFIECYNNYGHWYGSPKVLYHEYLEKDHLLIKAIDVRGAKAFKEEFEDFALVVFLAPPSMKELQRRLIKRDGVLDLMRYKAAKEELNMSIHSDFTIINDDLQDTVEILSELFLLAELQRQGS
jgi:guanylate kinase